MSTMGSYVNTVTSVVSGNRCLLTTGRTRSNSTVQRSIGETPLIRPTSGYLLILVCKEISETPLYIHHL